MSKEQENLNKVREYIKKTSPQVTVRQVANDLNMSMAEAAQAVQKLEFTDDVDDLK